MAIRPRRTRISRPYASTSSKLETARERLRLAKESDKGQDDRELDDLKFYDGDQWPADIRSLRAGRNAEGGQPAVPARPCLTINKVKAPVLRVMNQERMSDLGVEITPADDFEALVGPIDDKEIELREGLVRRIQRTSEAADARSWAFQRAAIAGRGYYRVITRYMPGRTMQQEIVVARIFNQGAVKLDPTHEQPDGRDADWGFVGAWMPFERYLAKYPKVTTEAGATISNPLKGYDSNEDFTSLAAEYPDWFRVETGIDGTLIRAVYVTEYIYCEYESRTLLEFADGQMAWKDEVAEEIASEATDSRPVAERKFTHCIIDGVHVLEETEWPIPYTGIVKVVCEEVQPYDKERRVSGMVRPARDPQQGFNAMVSKMVEVVAYAPIPAIMMANGQDEGFQQEYAAAMTRTIPVLHFNQTDAAGMPAPPPFAPPRVAPIEPVGFALSMFTDAIQDTTGTHDVALGKTEKNVTSAKHAKLLTDETGLNTSGPLDNLTRSVRYEGLLTNELLWHVYGRKPGRLAQIVTGDGENKSVLVGQPFTMDPRARRPVPAQPVMGPNGMSLPPNTQEYTLSEHARFNVAIKVSKTYDTRREQEHQSVAQIIGADPNLMQVIGDLFFKSMDGPGHKEMAERMQLVLAPPVQEYLNAKKEGREPLPPQVQQQLAQAKKMIEAMTAQINKMGQAIQSDEAKQRHENARSKYDGQVKIHIEQLQTQADLAKAQVNAALQVELQKLKMAQANLDREDQQAHELGMASADAHWAAQQAEQQADLIMAQAGSDATMQANQSLLDANLGAGQTDHDAGIASAQTERQAQLTAMQSEQDAAQQAALAPEPEAE